MRIYTHVHSSNLPAHPFPDSQKQHNKKTKIRVIHQNLNTIGGCFLGLGLLFMFANKFVEKKSMFPQTPHAIFGWIALVGIVCQAVIGSQKLQSIDLKVSPKPYKWHGDSGTFVSVWCIQCDVLHVAAQ